MIFAPLGLPFPGNMSINNEWILSMLQDSLNMKVSLATTLGAAGLQILNKRCFFGMYFMGNLIDFI